MAMTQKQAINIVWDLALHRMSEATKAKDMVARDQWFLVINRLELEWPWLRQIQHNLRGLLDIPTE